MNLDDAVGMKDVAPWRRIAILASVGATIAAALYITLYWGNNTSLALLAGPPDKNRVDLFAEQVHGVKFDSDGKLVETLHAQRLDHYPERNESVLVAPVLDAQAKDGKIWNTTAETGLLIGDNEIQLHKNVVIVDREKTMRFESQKLTYFPDKQLATTDIAVRLSHLSDVTTALGMRANLNTNRVELLHNVDSRYAQTP